MNKLQQLLILATCVAGVNSFSVIGFSAIAQPLSKPKIVCKRAQSQAERLNQQAVKLYKQGRYAEAIPLAQEALLIREAMLGPDHPSVAANLNLWVKLYHEKGNYQDALPLVKRALSIHEAALGKNHLEVAITLNLWAELYKAQGNYEAALPLVQRMFSIYEAMLGEEHPTVATTLNLWADLHTAQGNYEAALPLIERALFIYTTALGKDHPEMTRTLNNQAKLSQAQGNYENALRLYSQVFSIYETMLGKDALKFSTTLNNLARLMVTQGNYQAAQNFYKRALFIKESALGKEHPAVATTLNGWATLYTVQGQYQDALPLYKRALSIYETAFGKEHPAVATTLNQWAKTHQSQGNYKAALPLYKRALSIKESALGKNHPAVATTLNLRAEAYAKHGNHKAALPLYKRALSIYEATLGEDHPSVAATLSLWAEVYKEQGHYKAALPLYERALSIYEATLGEDHTYVATTLNHLAVVHQAQGNVNLALAFSHRASTIEEKNLAYILVGISESRRQRYIDTLTESTNRLISLNINEAPTHSQATKLALTNILRRKGRVLEASINTLQQLRKQLTPVNQDLLDELNHVRSKVSNLRFNDIGDLSIEQYQQELSQLESRAEELENILSYDSAAFRIESEPVTIEAVKRLIPADAALVELVRYSPFHVNNPQNPWHSPHYAAYVLTQMGNAQVIDLGEAASIDQLVEKFSRSLSTKSGNVKTVARQLDKKIMAPVRELIGDKTHLLISPDSQLNIIPFDALVDERDRYLIQTYQISYLTSGRSLLKLQLNPPSLLPPVILANPDYENPGSSEHLKTDHQLSGRVPFFNFRPLPGTEREANIIATFFPNARIFTQQHASENAIKQLIAPSILHIATHGFFLTDINFISAAEKNSRNATVTATPTETTFPSIFNHLEKPLLRSGLALAGANSHANSRGSHGEDGIFTALEAASLNLQGTQLVVLSACETGLGAISNGEGVYGLRRAFAIAGAESQLISLWQIPDYGTSELMKLYYENLIEKKQTRSKALRTAQLALLETGTYHHPYYWASFILSGDWRAIDTDNGSLNDDTY